MQFYLGSRFESRRAAVEHLLDEGMVMVHLDARRDDVDVPVHIQSEFHLRLNLSYRFDLDHFQVTDTAIEASLSFRGERYLCVLPFSAMFAVTSHVEPIGYLWPESIPTELAAQFRGLAARAEAAPPPPAAVKPGASPFRVIDGAGGGEAADAPPAPASPATSPLLRDASSVPDDARGSDETPPDDDSGDDKPKKYGHLRIVK